MFYEHALTPDYARKMVDEGEENFDHPKESSHPQVWQRRCSFHRLDRS